MKRAENRPSVRMRNTRGLRVVYPLQRAGETGEDRTKRHLYFHLFTSRSDSDLTYTWAHAIVPR